MTYNVFDGTLNLAQSQFPPIVDSVDFLRERNWLCWDVGPAVLIQVTDYF